MPWVSSFPLLGVTPKKRHATRFPQQRAQIMPLLLITRILYTSDGSVTVYNQNNDVTSFSQPSQIFGRNFRHYTTRSHREELFTFLWETTICVASLRSPLYARSTSMSESESDS